MCLTQRSRVFGRGVMASRFVTILWLCSQLCYLTAANQRTIVEIELLATVGWKKGCQPFSCPCSQNVTHCPKKICSTSLSKESIPTIPFGNLNHPLPARSRFLRAAVRSTCFALWLHHAHPLVVLWDGCKPTNTSEIELLATVGWKWGCQPFSCRCSQNVTHCNTRFVGHVSFQESIPAIPFGYSKHPLPARSRFLRAAERSTCFASWLHPAHPFVAATEKECVSCKEAKGLVTELWFPRFVTMQWLCSQLCYLTAANQRTLFEIELLATVGWKCGRMFAECHAVGWKWGCRPFSCRCSQNVKHWQKEICSTSLSKESLPAIHFGYSKHPLPARWRFLRAAERSTFFALWLHHAYPFVAATGKNLSDAETQRVWSRSCVSQDLLQCSDCALICAVRLLQANEHFSRLSF